MLSANDLRVCVELLTAARQEAEELAERARRTEPREAHEHDDRADDLGQVRRRVVLAHELAVAYEAQLSNAAAVAEAAACVRCGQRPPDPQPHGINGDGLCAECRGF